MKNEERNDLIKRIKIERDGEIVRIRNDKLGDVKCASLPTLT